MRSTGIGCFFDDPVHELLGLQNTMYQSIYHFSVGNPVHDPRIVTLPPYHHLLNDENRKIPQPTILDRKECQIS